MENFYITCSRCNRTGIADVPIASQHEDPCSKCEGEGYILFGKLSDALIDLITDMKDKIDDIFVKVNE